jgi:RNA-directed DNA polymerase
MSEIFNYEKIYSAYLECRERKRKTINALKFEWDLEKNITKLLKELKARKYKPGRSICFAVKEPTPREIFAGNFRDRVIHHLLIREIEEIGERVFIYNTFSCRKGKGTHKAVEKLRGGIRKASNNYKRETYYCQLDIAGFFMSINKDILYFLFKELVQKKNKSIKWKEDLLWLAKTIIFNNPTSNYILKGDISLFSYIPKRKSLFGTEESKGLPIGNYSSQFFANLYLNKLDQFIKRSLKCKYYFRYVDDFILMENNKKKLKNYKNRINDFLIKKLDIKLNSKKTKIQSVEKGINFLGYFIKKDYILVRKRVLNNFRLKLKKIIESRNLNEETISIINSYFGHFRHANSFNLRKSIYKKIISLYKKEATVKGNYFSLKLSKYKCSKLH